MVWTTVVHTIYDMLSTLYTWCGHIVWAHLSFPDEFGNRIHRRVPTKELCSGPSTRRGAYVALRGRCVECYDRAPMPASGRGRKEFMSDGKRIPCVFYACDVCRKHLCRDCFHHVYDHHRQGRSFDTVTLR